LITKEFAVIKIVFPSGVAREKFRKANSEVLLLGSADADDRIQPQALHRVRARSVEDIHARREGAFGAQSDALSTREES
jgi:hypothetical protein